MSDFSGSTGLRGSSAGFRAVRPAYRDPVHCDCAVMPDPASGGSRARAQGPSLVLLEARRFGQGKEDHFFAGHGTDVMVHG